MEIWSTHSPLHNFLRVSRALDTFVKNVTVGSARLIGKKILDSIWVQRKEKQLYVAPNPIPNALILFLIDVARVN